MRRCFGLVVVIKKEDIVGAVKTTAAIGTAVTPSNSFDRAMSALDKVNVLLANPTINQIVMRIAARYGLGQTANADVPNIPKIPVSNPQPTSIIGSQPIPIINMNPILNPEKIYDAIGGGIDAIMTTAGDIPLSKAKEELAKNKIAIMELIKNAIKS